MKVKLVYSALMMLAVLFAVQLHADNSLEQLDVFDAKKFKQMYFRYAEGSLRNMPKDKWIKRWSRFDGIVLKAFPEEGANFGDKELETLRQFKRAHPNKTLLLHFNGRARDPLFSQIPSKAADFLYFEGTTNTTNILAKQGTSIISVQSTRVFDRTRSLKEGVYDDVVIVAKNAKGKLDWSNYEHAKLLKVDNDKKQITVRRDLLEEGVRSFDINTAHIALHAAKGPFFAKSDQRLWEYNWFSASIDSKNRNSLSESLSQFLADQLVVEHSYFDGVSIDVLTETRGNKVGGYSARLDLNQNGKGDEPSEVHDNNHRNGIYQFSKKLREKLGSNKLILADGGYINQRATEFFNGIESEGWPDLRDPELKQWSSGLNRHLYWQKFGAKPQLSYFKIGHYINDQGKRVDPSESNRRLVVAAAMLTNNVVIPAFRPNGMAFHKWPEFRKMKGLGNAVGETHLLDIQNGIRLISPATRVGEVKKLIGSSSFTIVDDGVKFDSTSKDKPLCIDTGISSTDMTLSLVAKTESYSDFPNNRPRIISVNRSSRFQELYSFIGAKLFESTYYFDESNSTNICLYTEGKEKLIINELIVLDGPDIRYREYEKGVLFVNPSFKRILLKGDTTLHLVKHSSLTTGRNDLIIPPRNFVILRH